MIELIFSIQNQIDIIKPANIESIEKFILLNFLNSSQSNTEKIVDLLRKENTNYEIIDVKEQFADIVIKTGKAVMKEKEKEFIVNLINIPSLIATSVITSFILLNKNAELVFQTETIMVEDIMPVDLTDEHLKILSIIGNGTFSITKIVEESNLSLATAWRRVMDLKKEGLVVSRYADYKLTKKGKMLFSFFSNE